MRREFALTPQSPRAAFGPTSSEGTGPKKAERPTGLWDFPPYPFG